MTEELERYITYKEGRFLVERFVDIHKRSSKYFMKVKWNGPDEVEATWEHILQIFEDVKTLTKTISQTSEHPLAGPALTWLEAT